MENFSRKCSWEMNLSKLVSLIRQQWDCIERLSKRYNFAFTTEPFKWLLCFQQAAVFTDHYRGQYTGIRYIDLNGRFPYVRITEHQYSFYSSVLLYKENPLLDRINDLIIRLT